MGRQPNTAASGKCSRVADITRTARDTLFHSGSAERIRNNASPPCAATGPQTIVAGVTRFSKSVYELTPSITQFRRYLSDLLEQ